MKVAVDAFGGDNAPAEIVKGTLEALRDKELASKGLQVMLVGNEERLKKLLAKREFDRDRLEIVNATEVITNDETPTAAIKKKKDSSIVVGLRLLKENRAGAFVSAGSTGALLTGATLIVGRIKGVERPMLATLLPGQSGYTFLADSGANVDAKASYLLQFAKMGSVYMKYIMNVESPRVGLVNIGAEKEKGNALTKEAYDLLEAAEELNFVGNVEARGIPLSEVDVAVCDAFVGNVILKHSEGLSKAMMELIKQELTKDTVSKVGALLSKNAYIRLKKRFDYSEIGGAPFLGLNGLVVKAHGSSNAKAIKNAIRQCKTFIDNDIVKKIEENL